MTPCTDADANSGAYRLHVTLPTAARVRVGRFGRVRLPAGHYVYVGSARRHLRQRVARHRQVASGQRRGGHWHIDALLAHSRARLVAIELFPGGAECALSRETAQLPGAGVPIPGFGATDCRAGCAAHLYALPLAESTAR